MSDPTFDGSVEGIRELQRSLRQMDGQSQKRLRETGNTAVQQLIVQARAAASTPMERAAAATIRKGSQQRFAGIRYGSKRVPFALGTEFGARQDRKRRRSTGTYRGYRQFRPWRGAGEGSGYFLWPTIRAEQDELLRTYEQGIADLIRETGLS